MSRAPASLPTKNGRLSVWVQANAPQMIRSLLKNPAVIKGRPANEQPPIRNVQKVKRQLFAQPTHPEDAVFVVHRIDDHAGAQEIAAL